MAFEFPIRVYWEDTDAGGIVFYANYLKFFERARTEWLRSLGVSQQALREEAGGMFVVADTAVRYLRPAVLDDLLNVSARIETAGRASLTIAQEARHARDGQLLATGTIRIGWVDVASMSPAKIPDNVLQALQAPLP